MAGFALPTQQLGIQLFRGGNLGVMAAPDPQRPERSRVESTARGRLKPIQIASSPASCTHKKRVRRMNETRLLVAARSVGPEPATAFSRARYNSNPRGRLWKNALIAGSITMARWRPNGRGLC